uniref:SAM domain-containing protein n=1 Tax=Astyanax mexicanus TaxID=7994 RepID=A0A8B9GXG6_ASTMX
AHYGALRLPLSLAGSPELELARQPAAICPSAQRSALTGEEGPRVEENALTPDQLLSDCRASLHQDEAVGSDREPAQGSVPTEEGKNCSNEGDVASPQEIEQAKNGGGIKRADSVKSEEITQDPLLWSVSDVVSYFTAVGFPEQAVAFRTQVSLSQHSVELKSPKSHFLTKSNLVYFRLFIKSL